MKAFSLRVKNQMNAEMVCIAVCIKRSPLAFERAKNEA